MAQIARKIAVGTGAVLLILAVLSVPLPVRSGDYARRIAVAPFVNLTGQDEIKPVVAVLPRLISTRLMALAGAETVLLPQGERSAEEAAKEASVPLLLQGTVSKLGKGYSIDTTVTDLSTGKAAGAFFASAATEDEIIPQLGVLAADMAEKLFGEKVARPQPAPAPAPAVSAQPSAPAAAVPATGAVAASTPAPPAGNGADDAWVPVSLKKIAESGVISDELHGIVAGDVDSEGNREVIAYGKRGIYLQRVAGKEFRPGARIADGLPGHILNMEAVDLDGDGRNEIVVTGIDGEDLRSSVWRRNGESYEKIADRIPWFLVLIPDWQGKAVVAGQGTGSDRPFDGKLYAMSWDGKTLKRGEALPADTLRPPLSSGILGLSSAKFGDDWKWIYVDENSHLRVVDAAGNTVQKSGAKYGWTGDFFEWGIHVPRLGKTRHYIRKAPRVSRGADGSPLILAPMEEEGLLNLESTSETTRLVLLRWDGGDFVESAGTVKGNRTYSGADFISRDGLRRGGKVAASVIEQRDDTFKGGLSRLLLFEVE